MFGEERHRTTNNLLVPVHFFDIMKEPSPEKTQVTQMLGMAMDAMGSDKKYLLPNYTSQLRTVGYAMLV